MTGGGSIYEFNIGTGTTSPSAKLEVADSSGSQFEVDPSNSGYVSLKVGGVEVARLYP